ncbi:MAG: hypothetical protein IJT34_04800 [Butyrivibrio sp.]|nr:hypothetical protein [Butyrivibrio sp.]
MAKLFQYVRPDQIAASYREHRDGILRERPIVAARLGDFALSLARVDADRFSLTIEDEGRHERHERVTFDLKKSSDAEITMAAEALEKRMSVYIRDEVAARREQIWKWHISEWLDAHEITWDDFIEAQMGKRKLPIGAAHWPRQEEYLHGAYQEIGPVLRVIDRYAATDAEREEYRRFAAADIMELQQEQSRQRLMAGFARQNRIQEAQPTQTYTFHIEVDAVSAVEAEDKLRRCLRELRDPDIRFIMGQKADEED